MTLMYAAVMLEYMPGTGNVKTGDLSFHNFSAVIKLSCLKKMIDDEANTEILLLPLIKPILIYKILLICLKLLLTRARIQLKSENVNIN